MTTTIWKYPVDTDAFTLQMPAGATVLSVAVQNGDVNLWAEVDPVIPSTPRKFRTSGTGHPLPTGESRRFIGTFLVHGGALVFHLFEILEGPSL